jgi:hypothetical protein
MILLKILVISIIVIEFFYLVGITIWNIIDYFKKIKKKHEQRLHV